MKPYYVTKHISCAYCAVLYAESEADAEEAADNMNIDDMNLEFSSCEFDVIEELDSSKTIENNYTFITVEQDEGLSYQPYDKQETI